MTITALNVTITIICIIGGIMQILGARIEQRPCKYIKLSYAFALFACALFVIFAEIRTETETGYGMGLLIIVFNIFVGSCIRYFDLKSTEKLCGNCPHA